MTDKRKDEMPDEIWAYITSGSNCRHWKRSEIKWGWHHQNPTKYIRAASTPSAEVQAENERLHALLNESIVMCAERRGEIQKLREALEMILRVKTLPDHSLNTFNLTTVHNIAETAINQHTGGK